MKRKQFIKGISQIAQEGAIQIFQEFNTGMEEIIVGVVGVLQFEVLTYRLENEYNVEVKLEKLPYEYIRWVENADGDRCSQDSGNFGYEADQRPQRTIRCFCLSTAGVWEWWKSGIRSLS